MGKQNTDRKAPVTHKDLAILAMMQGVDSLDAKLVDHTDPVGTLEKVRKTFDDNGQDCTALDAKIDQWRAAKQPGVKGRKPVVIGETRAFSVQRLGDDGDLFIRLPVRLLGAEKGSKVACTFDDGVINVVLANDETDTDGDALAAE